MVGYNKALFSSNIIIIIESYIQTGPYPPDVIIKVMYSNLIGSLPVIYATMTIYPRTPVYDISEFKMIITNASDGSILNQTMIPSSYGNNTSTVDVHELLPHSLSYGCTKLRLTVTVASDMYGESNPTERDVMIFKCKFADLTLYVCQSGTSNIKVYDETLQFANMR